MTPDRIERALDRLAVIMVALGDKGANYLPIYEKLESELTIRRAQEDKMAEIHERARRVKAARGKRRRK